MKYLFIILILFSAASARSQCSEFDNLLKKGDNQLKGAKPNYQEAINAYTAAILACTERASEAKLRLAKMVSDINKLKENAVISEEKVKAGLVDVEKASRATQKALDSVKIVLANLDMANEDKVRLILSEVKRFQQDLNFIGAVDKIQTAKILRALPDEVQEADRLLALALLRDYRVKILGQDFKTATQDLLLAQKLSSFTDSVEIGRNQLVNQLFDRTEIDFSNSEYLAAVEKAHLLYQLQAPIEHLSNIYLESAFCLATDTAQWKRAIGLLDTVADFRRRSTAQEMLRKWDNAQVQVKKQELIPVFEQLNPGMYKRLTNRYFPDSLVRIPAGQFTFQ
jgi:hypothetical protein